MLSTPFRFDETDHSYTTTDGPVISITGMLAVGGFIDDRWYTEESSERGKTVHKLTADYDLGAIGPRDASLPFRGYLAAHVTLMGILKPTWLHVEVPAVHPTLKFAGRCDRVGYIYKLGGVLEVKSGTEERAHPIQTALQAILAADTLGLPAEHLSRYAAYYQANGRYRLIEHKNPRDFVEARQLIARYAA